MTVAFDGVEQGTETSDADGEVSYLLSGIRAPSGMHTITMTAGDASAFGEFTIEAPGVTVSPDPSSEAEFASSGIIVRGDGFYPEVPAEISIDGEHYGSVGVDDYGSFAMTVRDLPVEVLGEHALEVSGENGILSAQTTFTVAETTVKVEPGTVTIPELADAGVTVSGTGWYPAGTAVGVLFDREPVITVASDAAGNVSVPALTRLGVAPGAYEVMLATGDWSETAELIVSGPVVSVEPETVSLPDFVNSGVQVSGTGFPADVPVNVKFSTDAVATVESDAAGNVLYTLSEHGTAPGEYDVTLSSGELSASASLTIDAVGPTSVSADPDSVTPAQLAGLGITITGENFAPGAPVAISVGGTREAEVPADSAGAIDTVLTLSDYVPGAYTVTADDGILLAAETTLTITPDPNVTVDPSTVTASGLAEDGVSVSGTVFPAAAPVEVFFDGDFVDTVESDAAGTVSYTLMQADAAPGVYEVTLVSGDWAATASLEVYDPAVTVAPETVTVTEFEAPGITVSGSGFPALASVELVFDGEPVATFGATAMVDEMTDADGNVSVSVTQDDVTPGDHEVTVRAGGVAASALVTVVADPVYDPYVSLSPEDISRADLRDGGVEVTGSGYPSGTEATVTIEGESAGAEVGGHAG